jgi:CMP-N,N'-diacetyllegionaminic acid synthase
VAAATLDRSYAVTFNVDHMSVRVLGVVTARAGSRGIPGKNTKLLGGKPLIAYTIETALASGAFDRVILSSDDESAASIARARGCEVPFMRPDELCADDTPHLPVMQHALAWMRDHERYEPDLVMTLLPTSPLRQPAHIRAAIQLAVASGADSVIGVDELPPHFNPMRVVTIDAAGWARLFVGGQPVKRRPGRRQDMPQAWVMNGAIYLFRTGVLFDPVEPNLYGDRVAALVMPPPYGLNLDEPDDWELAERLLPTVQILP